MSNNDSFLLEIEQYTSDFSMTSETIQYIVKSVDELSRTLQLVAKSKNYVFKSVKTLGFIEDTKELVQDLVEEQKPEGLETGD